VKLQVRKDDAEIAKKILNEDFSSELDALDEQFPQLQRDDFCSKCGSSNVSAVNTSRKAGALLLLGLPLILFRKRYKCSECGHIIKK